MECIFALHRQGSIEPLLHDHVTSRGTKSLANLLCDACSGRQGLDSFARPTVRLHMDSSGDYGLGRTGVCRLCSSISSGFITSSSWSLLSATLTGTNTMNR